MHVFSLCPGEALQCLRTAWKKPHLNPSHPGPPEPQTKLDSPSLTWSIVSNYISENGLRKWYCGEFCVWLTNQRTENYSWERRFWLDPEALTARTGRGSNFWAIYLKNKSDIAENGNRISGRQQNWAQTAQECRTGAQGLEGWDQPHFISD